MQRNTGFSLKLGVLARTHWLKRGYSLKETDPPRVAHSVASHWLEATKWALPVPPRLGGRVRPMHRGVEESDSTLRRRGMGGSFFSFAHCGRRKTKRTARLNLQRKYWTFSGGEWFAVSLYLLQSGKKKKHS